MTEPKPTTSDKTGKAGKSRGPRRVSAAYAVDMLAPYCGGRERAQSELWERLRSGALVATAKEVKRAPESLANYLDSLSPGEKGRTVFAGEWRSSEDRRHDENQAKWATGDFIIRRSPDEYRNVREHGLELQLPISVMNGVTFALADIQGVVDSIAFASPRGPGGSLPRAQIWHDVVRVLMRMQRNGELNRTNYPHRYLLRDEVRKRIMYRFGDDTLEEVISSIWEEFVVVTEI